jgi:hypothetical protein
MKKLCPSAAAPHVAGARNVSPTTDRSGVTTDKAATPLPARSTRHEGSDGEVH